MLSKLFFLSSIVFGCSQASAVDVAKKSEGTGTYKISGSCPRIETKQKQSCREDVGKDYEGTFTLYSYEPKPSKNVKTISKACPMKLIEDSLKLPEREISYVLSGAENFSKIKFKFESCTLLENSKTSPQLAIIISTQEKPIELDEGPSEYQKTIFVKVDNKDAPQKIIKVFQSNESYTRDRESYQIAHICDTNGDGLAEIIFHYSDYLDGKFKVANISTNVDDVSIDAFQSSKDCYAD